MFDYLWFFWFAILIAYAQGRGLKHPKMTAFYCFALWFVHFRNLCLVEMVGEEGRVGQVV